MYENLYSYNEDINGKSVWMLFKPNFREEITLFNGKEKILSDGKVTMVGELTWDCGRREFPDIFISEDAQWGLEDNGFSYVLFVTEHTKEIITPLGSEWNKEFNRILKKCKEDYYQKKKKEIRLYFYEASKDRLKSCYLGDDKYCEYSLNRYSKPYCAIDKKYKKPDKDCFILGRIRKTIGLKNSKLLNFIEPMYEISLDFKKHKWDIGDDEYRRNISDLEKILYELLKFTIVKNPNSLEIARIQAHLNCKSKAPKFIKGEFTIKIMDALDTGDTKEVRKLYEILSTPQDCTNVKFELRIKEEITCLPDKNFNIFFENGEFDYLPAKWVYENIHNCTDASGLYLGKITDLTNRYKFY